MTLNGSGRTSGWQWRMVFILVLGAWMIGSPAYRQVFKGRSKWFPRWVMFHGFGKDICQAKFFSVGDDKTLQPIDRFEVLGRTRSWSKNRSLVRMKRTSQVKSVALQLCSALGPGADVRVHARCGSRDKWRTRIRTKKKFCPTPKPPEPQEGGEE